VPDKHDLVLRAASTPGISAITLSPACLFVKSCLERQLDRRRHSRSRSRTRRRSAQRRARKRIGRRRSSEREFVDADDAVGHAARFEERRYSFFLEEPLDHLAACADSIDSRRSSQNDLGRNGPNLERPGNLLFLSLSSPSELRVAQAENRDPEVRCGRSSRSLLAAFRDTSGSRLPRELDEHGTSRIGFDVLATKPWGSRRVACTEARSDRSRTDRETTRERGPEGSSLASARPSSLVASRPFGGRMEGGRTGVADRARRQPAQGVHDAEC